MSSQTSTPSRQGRLAPPQSGSSRSPASPASIPVRPALQTIITPSASTSPSSTRTIFDQILPSTESDLSPVTPPNDHEELLYQKPSKQQRNTKPNGQPASSSGFSSKSINLTPLAGSTSATTSQRCVSAPSLGISGRLQKSPVAPSSAKRRSQNRVTTSSSPSHSLRANPSFQIDHIEGDGTSSNVSTLGLTRASTKAENASDTEIPDSPSPRSRRPLSTTRNLSSSSTNPKPAVSSSPPAASRNRFTVPSGDSSSYEDEESASECLDDPFTEGATAQTEDGENESVSSPIPPLEFINYRTGGHRSLRETNEAIRNTIKQQLKLNKDPKGGFVYAIYCPDDASSYLKIGKTVNVPEKRLKTWSKDCCIRLVLVTDPSPQSSSPCSKDAFLFYGLVESIVHQEFHNQRKRHLCKRHKHKHNEWFDISSETAYHSINRWRTWLVVEQPFEKSTGKLKPYWQWKVDNLNKNYSTLNWDVWTQPSYLDWWEYKCDDYPRMVHFLNHLRRKDLHFYIMGCFLSFLGYFLHDGPEWKWCFFVLSLLAV